MPMNLTPKDIARFLAKIDRSGGPDACWPFTGCCDRDGYGVLTITKNNKWHTERAHRIAWVIENGEVPSETPFILHSCDNPPCSNPAHLRAGTSPENVAECIAKRRNRYVISPMHGSTNGNAKLTESDIEPIRQAFAAGESQSAIAVRCGVSQALIWRIVRGRSWRHV